MTPKVKKAVFMLSTAALTLAYTGCGSSSSQECMDVIGYPYASSTAIGNGLNGSPVSSLAFDTNGTAYVVAENSDTSEAVLYTVDSANATATIVYDSWYNGIDDMAYNAIDGKLYVTEDTDYVDWYEIATGNRNDPSYLPNNGAPEAIAIAPDGTTYYVNDKTLYILDTTDGAESLGDPIATLNRDYIGLGYYNGMLYGASSDEKGAIYTINPTTFSETYVNKVNCPADDGNCTLEDIGFKNGVMYGVMGGSESSTDPDQLVGALVKWNNSCGDYTPPAP